MQLQDPYDQAPDLEHTMNQSRSIKDKHRPGYPCNFIQVILNCNSSTAALHAALCTEEEIALEFMENKQFLASSPNRYNHNGRKENDACQGTEVGILFVFIFVLNDSS